jgi:hypothetical protein
LVRTCLLIFCPENESYFLCLPVVIAAAGNDGAEGTFYISSPGTGSNTIAAASVDNLYNLQQTAVSEEGAEYRKLKLT